MSMTSTIRKGLKPSGGTASAGLIELAGEKELARALVHMKKSSATRIMRPAISKGLGIAKTEAKQLARRPDRSGALSRAIAMRARVNRKRDGVTGMLYVRRGRAVVFRGKKHDPAQIAHLVEFGTRHSRPHPFLRASLGNKRSQIDATITRVAKQKHDAEAKKAASRGRTL